MSFSVASVLNNKLHSGDEMKSVQDRSVLCVGNGLSFSMGNQASTSPLAALPSGSTVDEQEIAPTNLTDEEDMISIPDNQIFKHTTIFQNKNLIGEKKQRRFLYFHDGNLIVENKPTLLYQKRELVVQFTLDKILSVELDTMTDEFPNINLHDEKSRLLVQFHNLDKANAWMALLNQEITLQRIHHLSCSGQGLDRLNQMIGSLVDSTIAEGGEYSYPFNESAPQLQKQYRLPAPILKIVILVVGTRGDVQPFINLGLELQSQGHDVRIATHAEYRHDVQQEQLKYYPLAGDPRKLSEYMVKTAGRLIPDLTNEEERNELPEKMQMLREICFSTWPACTKPDPEDPSQTPFVADAIISNPVSYGHIHCAEALGVPLVIFLLSLFLLSPLSLTLCLSLCLCLSLSL
jgi:hypothetical protein